MMAACANRLPSNWNCMKSLPALSAALPRGHWRWPSPSGSTPFCVVGALPDGAGRELSRWLGRAGVQVPILMLTGADSDADAVLGLDSGADDYVTKPFRLSVLLARLRAHLRQSEHSDDAVFTIGPYTFRP